MSTPNNPEKLFILLDGLGDMFEQRFYLREAQAMYLTHASEMALSYREYIGELFSCLDEVMAITQAIRDERK